MKRLALGGALVAIVIGALALSRGWADGLSAHPLYYSGVLQDDGGPVEGTRDVEVTLWDDAAETDVIHRVCETRSDDVAFEEGHFRVGLDAACAAAVQANPDLWVELRIDDDSLGRSKIGAVPYAVEAGRASEAAGALRETIGALAPPGLVASFAGPVAPTGWLLCDGAEVSRTDYPALFAAIGTAHGSGDGATTFRLPDLRGRFVRGVDASTARDPDAAARTAGAEGGNTGDAVGSFEDSATAVPRSPFTIANAGDHNHSMPFGGGSGFVGSGGGATTPTYAGGSSTGNAGDHTHTLNGGDSETRPENVALNYIIRY